MRMAGHKPCLQKRRKTYLKRLTKMLTAGAAEHHNPTNQRPRERRRQAENVVHLSVGKIAFWAVQWREQGTDYTDAVRGFNHGFNGASGDAPTTPHTNVARLLPPGHPP
jgi:hypothetical protein